MREALFDLLPGERTVSGALDVDRRVDPLEEREALEANQFPLTVEIGGDDDPVKASDDLLEGPDDAGLRDPLIGDGVDQAREPFERLFREISWIVELDNVPTEADDGERSAIAVELEDRGAGDPVPFHPAIGEDHRDSQRGAELLRDDEGPHGRSY